MLRKILVADDNKINRMMLRNILSNDYDVIEACDGKEALSILHRSYKYISAVVLDIIMPEMDGFEVLRNIRGNTVLSQIPVIIATSSSDEDISMSFCFEIKLKKEFANMNKKYTEEEKLTVAERYLNGDPVAAILADTPIPRSTIYAWIKEHNTENNGKKEVSAKTVRLLENKVARLEGIIEIMKKSDCSVNDLLEIKLPALEKLQGQYSVHMLCEALDVPRGTYYNYILHSKRTNTWYSKRREELRQGIQKIYDDSHQIFGSAKVTAILKEDGQHVSVEMVRELMHDMGLISIRQDAKDLYDKEQKRFKNYLNQQFTITRPNEVWVSDVTCFRFNDKNYYICVVLDLFSRMAIGYRIAKINSTQLVRSTFAMAYEERQPELTLTFHTDRGSNYRSRTFCAYLKSLHVEQSFSRAHIPYDNSVMESFFSNLKREELYRTKYRSENEFRTAVDKYIMFYNEQRPHAKNGYKTPLKKELEYLNKQALLASNSN